MRYATSTCQSFGQRSLVEAVCACFFEAVKPAQLARLLAALSTLEQEAVRQLSLHVPAIWEAETTTMADRKRLVRTVIQEGTLTPTAPRQATMTLRWSGDVTTSHESICPPSGWHCLAPPALVERLRALASRLPDHQIAELLTA
jgi:hypothetical protein